MCQLLGLNSNLPTDICFSWTGFKARGGVTDNHADGWGAAFFQGRAVRVLHDAQPSCSSALADMLGAHPIAATHAIVHIRRASRGDIRLENTHPFQRELWGRHWVFAHNGTLPHFSPPLDGTFQPVGTTDSELTFCWLMQSLRQHFGAWPPAPLCLLDWLRQFVLDHAHHGELNFLLSNGDCLFAHSSTQLSYLIRQAPFASAHLIDTDVTLDFSDHDIDPSTRCAIIATTPLTDNEPWVTMPAGSLWCFDQGAVLASAKTVPGQAAQTSGPGG